MDSWPPTSPPHRDGPTRAASLGPGTLVANTYRVVRFIGHGGMGAVFEVRHERTKAAFALKLLAGHASHNPDLVARFRREAETTSGLSHPNIVRVFDFDILPDGRPYLAMELLSGQELSAHLMPGHGVPLGVAMSLIEQIGLGLTAAHAGGIVHRDLKPSNIFLVPLQGTAQSVAKILDFGISKVRDAATKLTHTATVMGTPSYMSPEQANGDVDDIDARTDQFALGAIVYELVTGQRAFPGEASLSILYKVVHADVPAFSTLGIQAPPQFEAAVRKALAKNKADRWPDVASFVQALKAALQMGDTAPSFEPMAGSTRILPPVSGAKLATTLTSSSAEILVKPDSSRGAPRGRRIAAVVGVVAVGVIGAVFVFRGGARQESGAPNIHAVPAVAQPETVLQTAPATTTAVPVAPIAMPAEPRPPTEAEQLIAAPSVSPEAKDIPANPKGSKGPSHKRGGVRQKPKRARNEEL